jgi:hypothetical protein
MTHFTFESNWWAIVVPLLVQTVVFLRWLYRRIRNDEMTRAFVEDMATIHLPHTYDLLERIFDAQNMKPPARPKINWIDHAEPRE